MFSAGYITKKPLVVAREVHVKGAWMKPQPTASLFKWTGIDYEPLR